MSGLLVRRLRRPTETARLLAIRWLPLRLRWRLLGLVALLRQPPGGGSDPAEWQRELDGIALPPPAPLVDPSVGGASPPRVSVLIVTHDNVGLTRLCLDSLDRFTAYPDLEVVVVDNASSDDTPAMLRARAAIDPRLRVVLEPENRGFAAGCNRAAREASGEVLCFLNNDTVLTPGWLGPLVAALEDDPGLGLVGPVSNGVANEARVRGSYRTLAELLSFAADRARRHRGRAFSIPMLALYCAALRRTVWEGVGPLDEGFGLGLFEDDDYARRLRRAGLDISCREDAFVHHWQQASFDQMARQRYLELYERNRKYLREKWGERIGDGYGNGYGYGKSVMGGALLSVVIPTRDRRQVLAATLAALGEQIGLDGNLEVIVVDDGSRDGTPELLAAYSNPSFTFRWLAQAPAGPASARNRGVAVACAPRVLLLGDDNLPAPGSLAAHLEAAGGREVAVQGRIDWDPGLEQTPVMRFLAPAGPQFYFRGLEDGQLLPWSAVLSSNMSAPTRFLREEPFDERYPIAGLEDTELAFRWSRRGFETVWSERAVAWHRHRYDVLGPFLDRQRAVGNLARRTVRMHPAMAWRVILLPVLMATVKAGCFGASRVMGRGTVEQTWDLRCRGAYLRGLLLG